MRYFLIVLLSLLYEGIMNAQDTAQIDEYDVYLLIGQSNMAGRGYMTDKDMKIIHKNVFILNENGEVVPARNPLNQYSSIRKGMNMQRIGPGYGFAMKIAKRQRERSCWWSMPVAVQLFRNGQKERRGTAIMKRR